MRDWLDEQMDEADYWHELVELSREWFDVIEAQLPDQEEDDDG